MKNTIRNSLIFALCALMCLSAFGCSKTPQEENLVVRDQLEAVELKILMGTQETPPDFQYVTDEINRQLARSAKPYTVKFDFIAINGYAVNAESKAKAGYDGAWAHPNMIQSMRSKKVIKENLMPYIEKWGPKILENAKSYTFDQVTDYASGKVYAVPAMVPTANGSEIQVVRKDWMDKVGVSEIKTLDDFDNYLALVDSNHDIAYNKVGDKYEKKASFGAYLPDYYNSFLTREYCPSYYFPIIQDGKRPVYIDLDQQGGYTVKSFYQTQQFIDLIDKAREYYELGYIPAGSSNQSSEQLFYMGYTASISDYAVLKMSERINKFKSACTDPSGELYDFLLNSDTTPKTVFQTAIDSMVALSNSTHTEEFIDFLNWTKKQENHDLICYGVKNRNYYLTEDGKITFTNPDTSAVIPSDKRFSDYMPYWAMQDIQYLRFSDNLPQEYIDSVKNWEGTDKDGNPNFRLSPLAGFNIEETSAFSTALTKVNNASTSVDSLSKGTEKRDNIIESTQKTVYQTLVEGIKKDGAIDNLISEIQRQLDQFIANKAKLENK